MTVAEQRQDDPTGPVVFIVFSIAGVLYIILAKALGVSSVMVTTIPVLLMLAYAVCIWRFRALRLRNDQSGDNFYYMGFIFTLTSLAVTLIQFSNGADAAEIVRNFGVAVASTIAGIVLRIVFTLFRRDPVEVEHESRLALADAANKVRQELNGMLLEFSHFGRTQQQMAIESLEEYKKRAEEHSGMLLEMLSSEAHAETMAKARAELETSVQLLTEINAALSGIAADLGYRRPYRRSLWSRLAFWSSGARPESHKT